MTKSIKLFSGLLILSLFSSASNAENITKCVDAAGNITFTTMGCKTSETDVNAKAEAEAKVAAEEKANAEAKADEAAASAQKVGANSSTTNSAAVNTSSSSSASSSTTTTATQTESGNKAGMRGSINSDLTVGYQ